MTRTRTRISSNKITRARARLQSAVALVVSVFLLVLLVAAAFSDAFSRAQALQNLGSPNEEIRRAAAAALRGHPGAASVRPLLDALKSEKSMAVRAHLVGTLGALGDKTALPALSAAAAQDPGVPVRLAAVTALYRIQDPRSWDVLEKIAADPKQPPEVRSAALSFLPLMQAPNAARALKAGFSDLNPHVRAAALDGLLRIGHPDAEASLQQALSDKDAVVREKANYFMNARNRVGGKRKK